MHTGYNTRATQPLTLVCDISPHSSSNLQTHPLTYPEESQAAFHLVRVLLKLEQYPRQDKPSSAFPPSKSGTPLVLGYPFFITWHQIRPTHVRFSDDAQPKCRTCLLPTRRRKARCRQMYLHLWISTPISGEKRSTRCQGRLRRAALKPNWTTLAMLLAGVGNTRFSKISLQRIRTPKTVSTG